MQLETQPSIATETQKSDFNYDCFISYRRSDGTRIARWLRRHLLIYRLPRSFRKDRARALSVYLDTAYERATDDYYDDNIAPALKQSRFLTVVATPSARETIDGGKPNWVEREIADFLTTPQRSSILAVRAAGQWDDPFPGKLQTLFPYLHIVDVRDVSNSLLRRLLDRIITPPEIVALAAPLFGITQQEMPALRQEEAKRARFRLVSALASSAAVIATIVSLGAYGLHQKTNADAARQTIRAEYLTWQSGVAAADSPSRMQEALLLAIEGYRRDPSLQNLGALHDRADSTGAPVAQFKHEKVVNSVKFTPDGNQLVTASADGKLRVFDVETHETIAELEQDRPVRTFRFGPGQNEITATFRNTKNADGSVDHGRLVSWNWKEKKVTGQYDLPGLIYHWVYDAGRLVAIVDNGIWHPPQAQAVTLNGYAPDDRTLSSLSRDQKRLAIIKQKEAKTVDVFDVSTGSRVQSIPVDWDSDATAISFDRGGKRLLVGRRDGNTAVLDLQSEVKQFEHKGYSDPSAYAFSANDDYVAEVDGSLSSTFRLWRIEDGGDVFNIDQDDQNERVSYFRVAFSSDSRLLAVCLGDQSVRIVRFDADRSSQILHFTPESVVSDIAFHPTRPLLATADRNGAVILWRLDRGRAVVELDGYDEIARSEAGGRVALLGGTLKIVDTALKTTQLELDTKDVWTARFSRSGNLLVLGRKDGTIAMVDFSAGKISPWSDPGASAPGEHAADDDDEARAVRAIGFSSDEKQLILVRPGGVSVLDLATQKETVKINEKISSHVVLAPDDSLLASKTVRGAIRIYRLGTFEKPWEISTIAFDPSIAFSPDGKYLTGRLKQKGEPERAAEKMVVWDLATRQPVLVMPVASTTSNLAFNPSSEYFAFTDGDKIQVWNLKTKKRVDNNQKTSEVGSISFHPTELYLAAEYRDKKIRIWKLLPEPQIVAEIPQDQEVEFGGEGPLYFTPDGRWLLHFDGADYTPFGKLFSISPWKPDDVTRVACSHAVRKGLGPAVWDDYLRGEPYRETCALP